MKKALLISVRFHEGWYHGSGEIPSPARLFQALVAGEGISGPLSAATMSSLSWLECQSPPVVAFPSTTRGQPVTNYVPNNDLDSKQGDHRRIGEIRTKKTISPLLFDPTLPFLFAWQFSGDNYSENATIICQLTDRIYQLGRTIDMAWAWAEILHSSELEERLTIYPGIVRYPSPGNGDVDCPTPGSLESLSQRYAAAAFRFDITTDQKGQTFHRRPKSKWKKVSYKGVDKQLLFELRCAESTGLSTWPIERTTELVISVRDTSMEKLCATIPERISDIQSVLIGRKPNGENNGPTSARIRIIPLPSIGHPQADMQIRRLLVYIPGECPIRSDDIAWAVSGIRLTHPVSGYPIDLIRSNNDNQLYFYGKDQQSFLWRTVTPVVLPEATRRRIDPGRKQAEAKSGKEKYLEQIRSASAVYQALRHAGVNTEIISIKTQKEPFDLRGTRVEPFAEGTRFSKHSLWHIDLELKSPVHGPMVIGNGRFMGLGLMKAVPAPKSIEAMLLALSPPSWGSSALPHIHQTLPQGELFHRALVSRVGKGQKTTCPELTGQQKDGQYLQGGHQHAHILPLDLDDDQHLDHVLIYAKMGLGNKAQQAIRSLKRTLTKSGVGGLKVTVVGHGDIEALRQISEAFDVPIEKFLGSRQGSSVWISRTPMVMPRYIKNNGRNSIEGQIQAELATRSLPNACDIEILKKESIRLRHFIRARRNGGTPPPQDAGYAVRLTFAEAVTGPLCLGYASHFGLGLFVPVPDGGTTHLKGSL
jgi:CRISPR-associated protein Csb2